MLKPYQSCMECGHVYHTEKDFVDAHNKVIAGMPDVDPVFGTPKPKPITSGDELDFCAFCLGGF